MTQSNIEIIGVPLDLGQSRRGVDMGPSALRYAGLKQSLQRLGLTVLDSGNITASVRDTLPEEGGLAFLPAVTAACEEIYERGRTAIDRGAIPLFLGGDHSISAGTVGGASHSQRAGLLWIDAHGDFNTPETSPSGNLHGMPLAALCGRGAEELVNVGRPGPKMDEADVAIIGVRDLDAEERKALAASNVHVFTMREIDEEGIGKVTQEALGRLCDVDLLHVSLDMDSIDPSAAPGVGTPVPGGLTYREAHLLMEIVAETGKVGSIDVVEVNPILDRSNETAKLALGLLGSLLGNRIL